MTQLRVRARAVDMLGRQQIAGIPTAIHELFKNAHDAYAERAEVDYFRRNRVLVLRDDGYGMTRDDVENRWLTLGTESRVHANKESDEPEWRGPKNLPKRPIMGEKGIGRLAIAVIAPVTILMSRASRPDGLHNIVVALVHWGLFEQPGLDITSIEVPVEEYPGGTLPSRADIGVLIERVENNLKDLKTQIDPVEYQGLVKTLDSVKNISPDALDKILNKSQIEDSEIAQDPLGPLSLSGDGYGTHFIVLPVAPELDDDIDGGTDKESSKLERNLLGFSNLMATESPVMRTEFRDHTVAGVINRIGEKEFFNNSDFEKTDQYFEGKFDDRGQFVGTISVYGKEREFICNWVDGNGRHPKCGPFYFKYGYIQGRASESRLTPEDWAVMSSKTDKVGGLYIYRDGIRILPYGNSDVDWLDIEKRRNLSAKDWFFSYRRGFGYVSVTHSLNGALTEKAGREGFRENQAYRDFRSILMNLFKQLAQEFFKPSAIQGDDFWAGKKYFSSQAEALKKLNERSSIKKKAIESELETFFTLYNEDYFDTEARRISEHLEEQLDSLRSELDLGDFVSRSRVIEQEARASVRTLLNKTIINLPRGLSISGNLKKDWISYETSSERLREELIYPLRESVDEKIAEATAGRVTLSERRRTALQDIEREKENAVKEFVSVRKETAEAIDFMQASVREVLQEELAKLRSEIEMLVDSFARSSAENPDEVDRNYFLIEQKISALKVEEINLLDSLKRQALDLAEGIRDRETVDDRIAALESSNQELKEQVDFYSDFAQMGISVGILQHEFEGAARGIRVAMAELKPWAEKNPRLDLIYQKLRTHIEHLDGYLKVLDPLGRRLHRSTVEISGSEILGVIRRVFSEQLETNEISIEPTFAFRGHKIKSKSSAIMGAFVNVIDNSIYWLNSRGQGDKKIFLDADSNGFLISNNGPGIEERFRERIFDFGESRKPGGRGMGLSIARQTLRREGLDIDLVQSGADVFPQFKIFEKEEGV